MNLNFFSFPGFEDSRHNVVNLKSTSLPGFFDPVQFITWFTLSSTKSLTIKIYIVLILLVNPVKIYERRNFGCKYGVSRVG